MSKNPPQYFLALRGSPRIADVTSVAQPLRRSVKLKYLRDIRVDHYRAVLGCSQAMKEIHIEEQFPLPPNRLFERLAQIGSNYTWDQSIDPFHSVGSYPNGRLQMYERLTCYSLELRQLACLWNQA